jgi:DEAD/DEAH box helicase domain-containing protein
MSIRIPGPRHAATTDEALKTVASITPLPSEPRPEQDPRAGWPAAAGGRTGIRPRRAAPGAAGGRAAAPEHEAAPALRMLREGQRTGRLLHLERIPARAGVPAAWPDWVPGEITAALRRRGVRAPWSHQVTAADHARSGRNVIISTGTASGKSLGYLLPALTGVLEGGTALYIAPTKALAADQLAAVQGLALPGVRATTLDADTSPGMRAWARSHADYLLTNPDMLHHVLLPQHRRWSGFFARLRYVIIDECHGYRGVFGSHVGHVLRRLRRVSAYHARAGHPVFVLASATAGQPGETARRLTGLPAQEVTADGSPHGPVSFAMWEPPLTAARGEAGAPVRRTATAEAAELLAGLVRDDVATLAFIRSRRGAEAVALHAKRLLAEQGAPDHARRVAAYRSGYLAEDRRGVEAALRGGRLVGLATTTALELGVNITGLDAVLIAGWPGTKASLWQQAGRAGRRGASAVAVLIARDDPLDTYLVHHPEILRHPVEATVLDPENPYVLAPHLCAAAAELPLTQADLALFGPGAGAVAEDLCRRALLRRRPSGWYWTRRAHAARMTSLRGTGAEPVKIVEETTGRLVGTVDEPSAHLLAHDGATYLHQGDTYLVSTLDLADGVALVGLGDPGYVTSARQVTDIEVIGQRRQMDWGDARVCFGDVEVTRQVTSYTRRRADNGRPLGETPLDLPPRTLRTRAMWWTISGPQADRLAGVDLPGAAHAAEHASIGLLPLFATCDRWDIGGVSTDLHPATGRLTVFVYDGHEGGAGFAERGYEAAAAWLTATRQAIASCECEAGCPSCIQSPKCGNGNTPLSKTGALALLGTLLAASNPLTSLNGKRGAAPAGGESGGRRTVRPWGGGAEPASSKAYLETGLRRHIGTTKDLPHKN